VLKMTIIYGAHSDIRWDSTLYKILPDTSVTEQLLWPVIRVKQPALDPAE